MEYTGTVRDVRELMELLTNVDRYAKLYSIKTK